MSGWTWGADPISGFLNTTGSAIGDTIYNTANNAWGNNDAWSGTQNAWNTYNNAGSTPKSPSAPTQTGNGSATNNNTNYTPPSSSNPALDARIAALDRKDALISAQIAAQPKLIYRDTNAAWQNAQNRAASTVNPVYQDKLNNFLSGQAVARQTQQDTTDNAIRDANGKLLNTTADNAQTLQRSTQDAGNAIAMNHQQEGNWQTTEGTQANAQEEAARLALGDQAVAGRGAANLQGAQIARNNASNVQTEGYTNARASIAQNLDRTATDLNTSNTRATELNTNQQHDLNQALHDYILNQGEQEKGFHADNEANRLGAMFEATNQAYKTDTASWLASLQGTGARSQDIALAHQIYGG